MVLSSNTEDGKYSIKHYPQFQRSFEVPCQIGCKITLEMENFGYVNTRPGEGIPFWFELNEGDVILAGTDGLWDNLTLEHIVSISNSVENDHFCQNFVHQLMRTIMKDWKKFDDVTLISCEIKKQNKE